MIMMTRINRRFLSLHEGRAGGPVFGQIRIAEFKSAIMMDLKSAILQSAVRVSLPRTIRVFMFSMSAISGRQRQNTRDLNGQLVNKQIMSPEFDVGGNQG
jgi:hypothetical protein